MTETVQILLAGSVIAGIVSAIVSYLTSIRLKKVDFKNDYYKEILKKRLRAYEFIGIRPTNRILSRCKSLLSFV